MYQVVWVRSLSLIFGGSHLAVTAVLSIFMAGLALGGYIIGNYVDTVKRPLRLYGLLEIGIAVFAIVFVILSKIYPSVYIFLARGNDDSYVYLTLIRVVFSIIALIVPTTLMGGTLPVLSRFVSRQPEKIRGHLSFLYGFNTLGAVLGAALAGFFFLRFYTVSLTLTIAVVTNLCIGFASVLLQNRISSIPGTDEKKAAPADVDAAVSTGDSTATGEDTGAYSLLSLRLVLLGIGISGFCALGYEVLWTRALTMVAGASVYSFTTMLVAFLTGIALGSAAFGLLPRIFRLKERGTGRSILWFGIVQVVIGAAALLVTVSIRHLPHNAIHMQNFFSGTDTDTFIVRLWARFVLAYLYMFVPAFFMGVAFPLAGKVHAEYKRLVGSAVGEVLAYNTTGAILGAAVSGFALIYLFGIERSLQMFVAVNIGFGLMVIMSARNSRALAWGAAGLTAAMLLFLAMADDALRTWNTKYFAVYRNNQIEAFQTPEMLEEAVENTRVLYYDEGVEATISSIKVIGGAQALSVNGKIVASTHMEGRQCQLTLGHLPMLLHKDPRKLLVVGLGTGMTLGATSVHPSVEEMTLVEIEPKVIEGARTFEEYNHRVLDDPRLNVVFNDGRNFLTTTKDKFDVITADPIHPWAQGASYLYTTEYFQLAAEHLNPGGVMCQWLPVYELSTEDLKSVVRTFGRHFKYTVLWLTHSDAELIGSNSPITINEEELERRISSVDEISSDLKVIEMGSATDFLSYFLTGTDGLKAYARGGVINTDDNLYLEFSSPFSVAKPVMTENVLVLSQYMESILPYLNMPDDAALRAEQKQRWQENLEASRVAIKAHALLVGMQHRSSEFRYLLETLDDEYAYFAPARFLKGEYLRMMAMTPSLIDKLMLALSNEHGAPFTMEVSAVLSPLNKKRGYVVFLDNNARFIFGKILVTDIKDRESIRALAANVLGSIQSAYDRERSGRARVSGGGFPPVEPTKEMIKRIIKDIKRDIRMQSQT